VALQQAAVDQQIAFPDNTDSLWNGLKPGERTVSEYDPFEIAGPDPARSTAPKVRISREVKRRAEILALPTSPLPDSVCGLRVHLEKLADLARDLDVLHGNSNNEGQVEPEECQKPDPPNPYDTYICDLLWENDGDPDCLPVALVVDEYINTPLSSDSRERKKVSEVVAEGGSKKVPRDIRVIWRRRLAWAVLHSTSQIEMMTAVADPDFDVIETNIREIESALLLAQALAEQHDTVAEFASSLEDCAEGQRQARQRGGASRWKHRRAIWQKVVELARIEWQHAPAASEEIVAAAIYPGFEEWFITEPTVESENVPRRSEVKSYLERHKDDIVSK
jgi:hypothetical protein